MAIKAKLYIETALRTGKTFLKKSFCTQPFKITDVTEDCSERSLRLMVRSSSPGVLEGDDYDVRITLAEGCCVCLQTQSYQRLFQMDEGARQQIKIRLAKNASLYYLPHPAVPHAGSKFFSSTKIYLSENCSLLWSEIITCGRKLNGEVFRFSNYHSVTEVFLKDRLVVKENVLMNPSMVDFFSIGHLEGYSHSGSLLFVDEQVDITELVAKLRSELKEIAGIEYGISALPVNGLIVRLLGNKGERLFDCINSIATSIVAHLSSHNMTAKHISYVA